MANVNKIKIEIQGMTYSISTTQPEPYVHTLAKEIDESVTQILGKVPSLSLNDVLVLCLMNYADGYRRSEESADRMRTQVQDYLEDAAKARIELDEVRRELTSVRKRLEEKERQVQDWKEKAAHKKADSVEKASESPAKAVEATEELGQQSFPEDGEPQELMPAGKLQ